MATGDQTDFIGRLRGALPLRWFPDSAPVLNGILAGFASAWVITWNNLQFLIQQTRINTATGEWLDAISLDFFGSALPRNAGELDASYRTRILAELLQARGTRPALIASLTTLTGSAPVLFEPTDVRDCGGWGSAGGAGGMFYGTPGPALAARNGGEGGWGNTGMVFQVVGAISTTITTGVSVPAIDQGAANVLPVCGIAWLNTDGGGTIHPA